MKFKDKDKAKQYYEKYIRVVEGLKRTETCFLNHYQLATKEDENSIRELKINLLDMINEI